MSEVPRPNRIFASILENVLLTIISEITRSQENTHMIALVADKKTFDKIHFLYFFRNSQLI